MKWILVLILIFAICYFTQILLPEKECLHFNISETPFRQLCMNSKDHNLLLSIMKRLDSLLSKYQISYFVIAGSLMGAQRYQNRMPWDDDIDVGMNASERTRFESLPFTENGLEIRKVSFGYKVYDTKNHRRAMFEETFPFVDIFTFIPAGNKYIYESEIARKKWPREYLINEHLYPLSTCKYADMNLPCPANSIAFLNQAFSGWDKTAYISGSHSGKLLFRKYKMPINQTTTNEVLSYLSTL